MFAIRHVRQFLGLFSDHGQTGLYRNCEHVANMAVFLLDFVWNDPRIVAEDGFRPLLVTGVRVVDKDNPVLRHLGEQILKVLERDLPFVVRVDKGHVYGLRQFIEDLDFKLSCGHLVESEIWDAMRIGMGQIDAENFLTKWSVNLGRYTVSGPVFYE